MIPELDLVLLDEIYEFVSDNNVTDMNWNGRQLWIDDLTKGRYLSSVMLSENFIKNLSVKLSNLVNLNFNKHSPILEAETDSLRISIFHEAICSTGRSISIRKTPPERRILRGNLLNSQYCPINVLNFLENSVLAHCNIIIGGLTSVGKTEFLKYLTKFIPAHEKAITIEDNYEIHYSSINPQKDCEEIKVTEELGFEKAIKGTLRHNVKWTLLSEARGKEVFHLMNSLSNGTHCITTLHVEDALNIPDRLLTMTGDLTNDRFLNNIHSFMDIGVIIKSELKNEDKIERWIDQVAIIKRERDSYTGEIVNDVSYLYDKNSKGREFNSNALSNSVKKKFKEAKITNPFDKEECVNE